MTPQPRLKRSAFLFFISHMPNIQPTLCYQLYLLVCCLSDFPLFCSWRIKKSSLALSFFNGTMICLSTRGSVSRNPILPFSSLSGELESGCYFYYWVLNFNDNLTTASLRGGWMPAISAGFRFWQPAPTAPGGNLNNRHQSH